MTAIGMACGLTPLGGTRSRPTPCIIISGSVTLHLRPASLADLGSVSGEVGLTCANGPGERGISSRAADRRYSNSRGPCGALEADRSLPSAVRNCCRSLAALHRMGHQVVEATASRAEK